jgi:hypothetical protein
MGKPQYSRKTSIQPFGVKPLTIHMHAHQEQLGEAWPLNRLSCHKAATGFVEAIGVSAARHDAYDFF